MCAAAVLTAAALSSGCVVLSLNPVFDDQNIVFEESLLGSWRSAEDNVQVTVERGEWRSYQVHYKHPVDEADFTGRLTTIGGAYFLDLMPVRGLDYGAALIPAHVILKVAREGSRWSVSGLDYDRLRAQVRSGRHAAFMTIDQRQNIVLTGSTTVLRAWLRDRADEEFTPPATFERIDK